MSVDSFVSYLKWNGKLYVLLIGVFLLYASFVLHTSERNSLKLDDRRSEEHLQRKELQAFKPFHIYFQGINTNFSTQLKNPCWLVKRPIHNGNVSAKSNFNKPFKEELMCLPYFFVLGQPKCGTTDLFHRLVQHPDIVRPTVKGSHWWTRKSHVTYKDHWSESKWKSGFTNYTNYTKCFTNLSTRLGQGCDAESASKDKRNPRWCKQLITLDASPSTLWDSHQTMDTFKEILYSGESGRAMVNNLIRARISRSNTSEQELNTNLIDSPTDGFQLTVADMVHMILPGAVFIVMLRDPTERLYSSYKFFNKKRLPNSFLEFDDYVNKSIAVWEQCANEHSDRFCAYDQRVIKKLSVRLHIGMYSIFVKDWFNVFSRKRFFIIRLEDYQKNMKKVLSNIFIKLGLRATNETTMGKMLESKVTNQGTSKLSKMLPRTRSRLNRFYRKYNEELVSLLKERKFLWANPESRSS